MTKSSQMHNPNRNKMEYVIKAKQLYTAISSSIIVWLSLNEDDFNEDQTSDKCIVWIGFKDEMQKSFIDLNEDTRILTSKYIDEFRQINHHKMQGIPEITTNDMAQTMFWAVENFICSIIVKLK